MSLSISERERPCCGEVRSFHGLDGLLLTMEDMMDEAGTSFPIHGTLNRESSARRLSVCMPADTPASRARPGSPALRLRLLISKAGWNCCACSETGWSGWHKGGDPHDL